MSQPNRLHKVPAVLLLALGLMLVGCGPESDLFGDGDDSSEVNANASGVAASGIGTSPAPALVATEASGYGWKRLAISGTMTEMTTNTDKTITNDKVYVVSGLQGISSAPLPALIKSELNADLSASLNNKEIQDPREAIYFVHEKTAQQVADGTLKAPTSTSGVKTFALCGDYTKTIDKTVNFVKPLYYHKDFTGGGFSGQLDLNGTVNGSASGKLRVKVKRKWCVPYWVKFIDVQLVGTINADANLSTSGTFSDDWDWTVHLAKFSLGGFNFMIGPVPVHLGFNLPVDLGFKASAAASADLRGSVSADGFFNVTCTLGGCSGSKSYAHSFTSQGSPSVALNGRSKVTPWIQGAVRAYLYRDNLVYGQVGVKPYLEGDLWGYSGTTCGDADNDGHNEYVNALTLDADVGIDVTAAVYALGVVNRKWSWPIGRWHVGFWNLSPDASAIAPMFWRHNTTSELLMPGTTSSGPTFKGRMRPCWPYNNTMNYEIDWRDGTSTSFSSAPATLFSKSHSWSSSLPWSVELTALQDAHGRVLNRSSLASMRSNGRISSVPATEFEYTR